MAGRWNSQSVTKFLLFGVLYFLLIFSAVIVRDLKDVLIVTVPGGGAVLIPYLKSLAIWPQVILFVLFMVLYRRDRLPQLMFVTLLLFLSFFISFHFWIKPSTLLAYKIYYMMADLWGTSAIAFFFWALTNQTFDAKEAKWCYPLLGLFAMGGATLAGTIFTFGPNFILNHAGLLLTGCLLSLCLWSWMMNRWIPPLPRLADEQKTVVTTTESFRWTYLGLLLIILTAFGFCQHVALSAWKPYVSALYPSVEEYTYFMGQFSYYMGFSGFFLFLLTFWMIQVFGWVKSAMIPPLVVFFMVLVAVLCQRVPAIAQLIGSVLHVAPASATFWILVAQHVVLSGINGTLFFATKEMAYIPLTTTTKARGKAFIDLLFGRIGVSLGNVSLTSAFMVNLQMKDQLTKEISLTPLLIVLGVAFLWFLAVLFLGKLYKRITPQTLS